MFSRSPIIIRNTCEFSHPTSWQNCGPATTDGSKWFHRKSRRSLKSGSSSDTADRLLRRRLLFPVILSEAKNGATGEARHRREDRRLSEREVSESNLSKRIPEMSRLRST